MNTYRMAVVCETLEIKANTEEDAEKKYSRWYGVETCIDHPEQLVTECECVTHEEECYHITEKINPQEFSGGFLGRLETRNYEFMTYQKTVKEVLESLESLWWGHYEESGASLSWKDLEDSVTITPLRIGDTDTNCERCENAAHN